VFHRPLRRPLAIVSLLALADYLLWNWSLGGSRDILALVAGLTLVPLLIAVAWLLVRDTTRLLAKTARRTRARPAATATRAGAARARAGRPRRGALRATAASRSTSEPRAVTSAGAGEASTQASPSSKLAA
jgi:hypothetical protein